MGSGRNDFGKNMVWLRQNRDRYVGYWVALRNGNLVNYAVSRIVLQEIITYHTTLSNDGCLFIKV